MKHVKITLNKYNKKTIIRIYKLQNNLKKKKKKHSKMLS